MSGLFLETTVEKRFASVEEAQAFGKQMDCYGSVAARPDCITSDGAKFKLRKYHKHTVVTDVDTSNKMQQTFTLPALFPNQKFVYILED
jgi:hypothetical protein